MAAKTTYSEAELKSYCHDTLGPFATTMGWTVVGGEYNSLILESLNEYGASDIADIEGQPQVRVLTAIARVHLWRKCMDHLTGKFSLSADGGNMALQQMWDHAKANMVVATADVKRAWADLTTSSEVEGSGSPIAVFTVTKTDDPFETAESLTDEFSQ